MHILKIQYYQNHAYIKKIENQNALMNFNKIFNFFKYEKIFDASENINIFKHRILKYIWYFSDGKIVESDKPIIKRYFSKKGSFNVALGLVLECGNKMNCCYECKKLQPTFIIKD